LIAPGDHCRERTINRIEDLLARRSDLSAYLVHLTRDTDNSSARNNLLSILDNEVLEARSALGMGSQFDRFLAGTAVTQKVACLSETPLEHVWMMCADIEGRSRKYKPYGLVFERQLVRKRGWNPVWYLDISPGHDWLTAPINRLVQDAARGSVAGSDIDPSRLQEWDIFRVTPFFEQMGNPAGVTKEFSWEREWRHVGDFVFAPRDVAAVIAPEAEHELWRDRIARFSSVWKHRGIPLLDPTWKIGRITDALI
jgi:hypothetical protein